MKVTVLEITEHKRSFSRKTRCKNCGSKHYDVVVEQMDGAIPVWYVCCPKCGYSTDESLLRNVAIARWKYTDKKGE